MFQDLHLHCLFSANFYIQKTCWKSPSGLSCSRQFLYVHHVGCPYEHFGEPLDLGCLSYCIEVDEANEAFSILRLQGYYVEYFHLHFITCNCFISVVNG